MKRILKMISWVVLGYFAVVCLVYVFYQFETFTTAQPDLSFYESMWLTILNPTALTGGSGYTYPETLVGKLVAIVFVLISISLFGVFIGKIGDMFTEYREYRKLGYHGTDFEDHYVIIGWDNLARLVTEQLVLSGQKVAVVTDNQDDIDMIYDEFDRSSVFVLLSNLNNYENLTKTNVQNCHRLLINNPSDKETLVDLLNIKSNEKFRDIDTLVTIQEERMRETFIGRPEASDSDTLSGRPDDNSKAYWAYSLFRPASNLIGSTIFEPLSADFMQDLITSVDRNNDEEEEYELQLYQVTEGDAFYESDTDFGYAFNYIYLDGNLGRDYEYQCMPIAISKRLDGSQNLTEDREVRMMPSDDTPVEAGDYLILIAKGTWMDELENDFNNPQGLNPDDQGKVDWTRLSLFQGEQDSSYATHSNEDRDDTTSDRSFHDHIVIIGWDQVSKIITRRLRASDREVVVITDQESDVRTIEEMFPEPEVSAVFSTLSNYSVLDETPINITRSSRVFVNRSEDDESLVTIMNLEERYGVTPVEGDENLSVVAAISDVDLEQSFKTAGVTYTVSHDVINAKLITSYLYEEDVAFVAEDLLYGTQNEEDADLQQYRVNSDSACLGSTYLETLKEVKEEFDCLAIGIAQDKMGHKLQKLPKKPDTIQVEQGDYLLFIVKEKNETDLVDYMGTEEGH